jgi:hypothetical protein
MLTLLLANVVTSGNRDGIDLARSAGRIVMHIVEIRRHGADLGVVMEHMRTWLDHHRVEPRLFDVAFLPAGEIRFRVQFKDASDVSGFASVFGGEMLGDEDTAGNLAA